MEFLKTYNQISNKLWHGLAALIIVFAASSAGLEAAQMTYDLTDASGSINWRGGLTNVNSVTETYTYNEGTDTLTVTATFNASSSLAPLAPMLALAKDYGFPITFDQTVVPTAYYSTLGPLKGVQNTNTYTYHITGLGNYVLAPQSLGSGSVPSWLQQELEQQVDNVLAAGGHLRPWLVLSEVPGGDDYRGEVYWHYPGDTLYFLSEAAPLLSGTRLDNVKTYLQTERGSYPPETQASISFTAGTAREYCGPTDTLMTYWQNRLGWRTSGTPGIWNLYGLARYYELQQQTPTTQVMTNCTNLINTRMQYRHWPTLYWLNGHAPHYNAVHGVNQIFAGLVGYIRLARMAGNADAENLGWGLLGRMAALRYSMGKYTQYEYDKGYFQIPQPVDPDWYVTQEAYGWVGGLVTWDWTQPIDNVRQLHWLTDANVMTWEWCSVGFDQGDNGQKTMPPPPGYGENRPHWGQGTAYLLPFCDMVPELGKFMKDYLTPEVQEFCGRVVENQPHWYAAYTEAILGQEIGWNLPGDGYGQFIARAWVLNNTPAELAKYVDMAWLPKGDLFYIHKLAETIKAYRNAGAPDTTPPTPNPLTWGTAPHAMSDSSISMTATAASDPSGVEYFFDCTAGAGGHDSVWQNSSSYTDTGLSASTQYTYRVKARDKSLNHNEGSWSSPASATTNAPDTAAPTPNPSTWATVPYATGSTTISMTATTATDPAGVEYYFDCTNGGHDSGWQSGATYQDTGLAPDTQYSYHIQARDLSANHNTTTWSTTLSATTSSGSDPSLLAWWTFDETSGTNAADSSGNGNSGTLFGSPTWATGHFNNAISLDGTDDYMTLSGVNLAGVWTIALWARPLNAAEFQGLAGNSGGGTNYINLESDRVHYKGTNNNYTAYTQDSNWHHFAITRASSGDMVVYIDGTSRGTYNDTDNSFVVNEIGRFWGNSSYTYQGYVDDLRLYSRVLNLTEVQDVMNGGGGGGDTTPPTPNPSTWATLPHATGSTSVSMTATTATDPSGVQYYFDCTAGAGGHDSAWQSSATYQDTGLSPSTQYTYRMQTRDQSAGLNTGQWSTTQSATTDAPADTTPPTPNPSTWATVPYATGSTSISMTATTATDPSGVQYYFDCTTGGHDSGWQSGASYEDTGLTPGTQYSYRVQTRDQSANQNTGTWSTTLSATTDSGSDPSLLAWWKFDDGSGSSAADSSGNGYGGTLYGSPTWVTGQLGGGISLDGVDDYMAGFSVNLAGVWSVTVWAKPLAQPEFQGFVGASSGNYIQLQSNRFHYEGAGHNYTYFTEDLNWHHFAITRASNGDIVVYIDGSPAGSYNDTDASFIISQVGRMWDNSSYTYQGSVDDLRLYNRVLSQSDVQTVMAGGGGGDTTPPTPNPLTWATVPYATGSTSISMTATTASDSSGVEYFFDCTAGAGGHDSVWQDSATYQDTGLSPSTQYTYRVQARDKSANHNAGGWSTSQAATTDAAPDTTPPTPNPSTWATVPYATGSTTISMTATTASDPSGVQYFFDCTAGAGGHDSAWQSSATYQDTGLTPSTQYSYRVQTRDQSANQNTGQWSTTQSATTQAGGGTTVLTDGFETNFDKWTDGGATDWDRATAQKHTGSYSAHAGNSDNDLISDNVNTAGYTSMTIDFWYMDDDIDDDDNIYLQLYNGSAYADRLELGNSTEDTWQHATVTVNNSGGDAAYFISNFRVKFEGTSIDSGENLWIDDVLVTVQGTGGDASLVAWWKFDETSGTTAADSSGNGETGTTYGSPTWTTGHINGGLTLDGVDDYVSGFSVDLGGVWSIAVWAKPLAAPEFQGLLGTTGGGGYYVQLQSNRLHYKAMSNHYTSFTQDLGWHHFAITRAASGDLNVYIDGAPADSYNDTATPFVASEIGRFWGDSAYTYEGVVDDLRLYNRVLTPTEVQNLSAQ